MEVEEFNLPVNEYQTPLTKEFLAQYPDEVVEQFFDYVHTVPYIQNLISPARKRAKDLPRDEKGRIVVDLTHPHILEDMDYFRPAALHYEKHGCYTFLRPNKNPNSEYYKWINEEKRRCWEGYVRPTDGEWVTGYMYWYMNYCPIMLTKIEEGRKKAFRTEGFPETWEGIYLRFHYIEQARNAGSHGIELARRGAHPYFQKVFTPEGWKKWGDIKIGDTLYNSYGGTCKVIDIPYDDNSVFYRIILRDGREVYATDDHLWNIEKKGQEITVNTAWLMQNFRHKRKVSYRVPSGLEHNCFIRKNKGIEMPYKTTNVEPYTFGLLLGDGCFRAMSCYYTQHNNDMEIEKNYIPYNIVKWKDKYAYKIDIPNWTYIKREYGLDFKKSEDKFIPDEYKYNSREVRLKLLKGLLDSDGHVHGGVPVLTSTSKRLADDVAFIARSLGYNTNCIKQPAGYKKDGIYIKCLDVYEVSIYAGPEVFNLPRKQAKVKYISNNAKSRRDKTCIIDIQYAGISPCKCVTVDSQDECYLIGDFIKTHNCSKSFCIASMLSKNLELGENYESRKRNTSILTAYQKEYLSDKDGTLSKFVPMIDFVSEHTEFPRLRLRSSSQDMFWQMGYVDEYGRKQGSLNTVMGVSSKDDESKLRGKRGHIFFEEMGAFPNLLSIYDVVRQGMEEGEYTYGFAYLVGTSDEDESNFESAKTLLYHPEGYNIYPIENVYDKTKLGGKNFGYFFPAYVNRKGCYNKDGVSDVVISLFQILMARYKAKYSARPDTLLRLIAEMPITPAEAIIKSKNSFFPVTMLAERMNQLEVDPRAFDDVLTGLMAMDKAGNVKLVSCEEEPIRKWKTDNTTKGAVEIFELPQKDSNGNVYSGRYIMGHDPVDNDQAESSSFSSTFVLDLFTDRIVAEYTGRQSFADENFEQVRLLCIYYNAICLFESNKKGIFAYFQKMGCTHLLAPTPQYLRDKQLVKYSAFGSNAYGVNATAAINNYSYGLIRDWLLKPITMVVKDDNGNDVEKTMPQLYLIRNMALLDELKNFNPFENFDRIHSLGMLMLLREERMIMCGGDVTQKILEKSKSGLAHDDFFERNYNR